MYGSGAHSGSCQSHRQRDYTGRWSSSPPRPRPGFRCCSRGTAEVELHGFRWISHETAAAAAHGHVCCAAVVCSRPSAHRSFDAVRTGRCREAQPREARGHILWSRDAHPAGTANGKTTFSNGKNWAGGSPRTLACGGSLVGAPSRTFVAMQALAAPLSLIAPDPHFCSTPPANVDPVGGYPDAWLGPHTGTLGLSPPPSGRGPIE